ncbi:ABC transporter permease [Streptococcus oricebi]|uniref:Transport permease protein n=1 Tax=Streptococcus oricebi TaxID=1547447 RepID=A0ABS5B631_9STRE|nr:ABC transporter permease [Streptococcus oricebi]MBP2624292.1 ABC transporter permease [Streptococcus oricebi]
MKYSIFANRNLKEITRDPVSILMGIGFPVLLIIALSLMKQRIGQMADIFQIQNFAPSMIVFGLSWLGMFVGTLMATDRGSSFLARLFASPLKSSDYILGYSLPALPLAIVQATCCFIVAAFFGLKIGLETLVALLTLLPIALLFIAFGLFMGTVLPSSNAVSGFGTILINATVFLSGAFIPLKLIGGAFEKICNLLPFTHAIKAIQAGLTSNYGQILPQLVWILAYTLLLFLPTILIFKKKMKG